MKQVKQDSSKVMSRYEEHTRDELVQLLDKKIAELPDDQRASVRFEIDEHGYAYNGATYHALFMKWSRPETDDEEQKREVREANRKAQQEARDLAEFQRLKKQFGA